MNDYRIERKVRGSRTLFYPTVNGKRINGTLFARKYDARNLLHSAVKVYGEDKLAEMTKEG